MMMKMMMLITSAWSINKEDASTELETMQLNLMGVLHCDTMSV